MSEQFAKIKNSERNFHMIKDHCPLQESWTTVASLVELSYFEPVTLGRCSHRQVRLTSPFDAQHMKLLI